MTTASGNVSGEHGTQTRSHSGMTPDLSLSVVNTRPTRSHEETLLHEIINTASSRNALEHLDGDVRESYTYGDLHRASDAIAAQLNKFHSPHDKRFIVPVLIQQSPLLYAALIGILKAGGAFCPLNLDAPSERISYVLRDVSAKVALVSAKLASKIPSDSLVEVITVSLVIGGPVESLTHNATNEDDLAYVMYTSGSTGTPKGVGISHRAAVTSILAHDRHLPQFDRFLQFAAPTFDVSVFEIFFPLQRGCTLVSVKRSQMLDDLPRVMRSMNVDACELTPTVAGSLLKTRSAVPGLSLILTIGEMLTQPILREFGGDEQKKSILWAMYGPTEAAIHWCVYFFSLHGLK